MADGTVHYAEKVGDTQHIVLKLSHEPLNAAKNSAIWVTATALKVNLRQWLSLDGFR